MLDRCHRKLEERLTELMGAAQQIAAGDATDAAVATVSDVLSFFDRSVARHEADEEQSLFPRLRGRAGIDPVIDTIIDTLSDEHREHTRLLYRLHELIKSFGDQRPSAEQGQHLLRLANELSSAYARHIALEDARLFPAVRDTLGASELQLVAAEMQARRGRD